MKRLLKVSFLNTLPIMAGYVVLGMGFGILMEKNGYGFWYTLAMSVFIYAGSMQYVGVSLLTAGASIITTAITTLMVNARHLFYGISMVTRYRDLGKKGPYTIFALTDETYSLVCDDQAIPEGVNVKDYYFTVSLFNQCYWVLGSVAGGLLGAVLPFDTTGIDFSMTALFVTVVTEQWLSTSDHFPALVGLGCSLVCLLIFGSANFLIPSMISITIALSLRKKVSHE